MKHTMSRLALAVAVASSGLSLNALAQDADTEKDDVETVTVVGKYSVNEKVDTATGLGLLISETPQSVSVITAERIQDQALDTIVDTVANTIGVSSIKLDNVRNTLQARGFDITNYQIDGVPLSWSLGADSGETIADVAIYERVEFVRGSTGLLTGAGDPSASINLVRKTASATELEGFVSAAYGSWDTTEFTGDVATGLNEDGTVRGRVVAKYREGDSFIDYYSSSTKVLYGVLEGDITDNTLLRVGMSYQNDTPKANFWGGIPGVFADGTATDFDVSTTTAAKWTRWETTSKNVFANLSHFFANGWELSANYNKLNYESATKLLYLYGSLDEETGAGLVTWPYKSQGESDQDSFDLQLKGTYELLGNAHEFVLGALYSKQEADAANHTASGDGAFGAVDNFYEWDATYPEPTWSEDLTIAQDMDTEQKGFYAATRFHVTDELKVIAGGRISSWERTGVSYDVVTDFGENGVFVPYLGALYDVTDQHRVYASYTEIFQPQNAQDRNGDFLDSVEGKTYEIGLKSRFLDDMLHTSFAIFKIDQDNLAQDDIDEDGTVYYVPGSDMLTVAQRGAQGVESYGFEFEVVGNPVEGWDITAGYSQFEAEDAADNKVNTAHPRKQAQVFTTYNFVKTIPELTVGGGVNWQSKTTEGSVAQDSYTLVNLMARYQVTDNFNVQLNANNLFDEKYYAYISSNNQVQFGNPRNVTLSVKYNF